MRPGACSRSGLASLALFDEQRRLAGRLKSVFLSPQLGLALLLLHQLAGRFLDAKAPGNRDHAKAEIGAASIRAAVVAIERGALKADRVTWPFFRATPLRG